MPLIPDDPNQKKTVVETGGSMKDLPGWKPHLDKEQMARLKQVLNHSDAQFFITAGPVLREAIIKGSPSFILHMDDWKKKALIEGNGIRISRAMLLKWLDNKVDPMNGFILDYSNIRVENSGIAIGGQNK